MTWLDTYAFALGSRMIKDGMVRTDDVAAAMVGMAKRCMSFANDPSVPAPERAGFQVEADYFAFFDASMSRRRSCLYVASALKPAVWRRPADGAERIGFAAHAAERPFVYIDFAPGAYGLGAGVELQAIFVRAARMVDETEPRMEPVALRFEVVLGPTGVFARHRLMWQYGSDKVVSAAAAAEPGLYPAVPQLDELLDRTGATAGSIAAAAQDAALVIVKRASTSARAMPRIPPGDRARRGDRPHSFRSLLQISEISFEKS